MGLSGSPECVNYGAENVVVCNAMVGKRGEGRSSVIAGPSTRNQRTERIWIDVLCVVHMFCYIF